jgi:DNA-binding cell septation regulator SpoVG
MFGFERESQDSIDIKPRLRRALEEPLSVVSTGGTPVCGNASIVSVESHSGNSYTVDVREGRCDCRDARYNLDDDQRCKHQIRAEMALGRSPVPVRAAEAVDVDGTLGAHTDASLQFVAADGGVIDGETGEFLEDDSDHNTDSEDEDVAESIWSEPKAEIDRYGKPTGDHYVTCEDCGVEVLTALTDCASHRERCSR